MGCPCWVPWKRSKLASSAPLIVSCKRLALALTRQKMISEKERWAPTSALPTYMPGTSEQLYVAGCWLQRRRDQTVK